MSEITTFSGFCDPRGKKSFGVNGGVNCNLRPFDFKLLSRPGFRIFAKRRQIGESIES